MGRSMCCEKVGLKKGPWTPEEDKKLLAYIEEHGHGSWRALPAKAGLQRCGKSCRLRWTNYLRPDIKRGKFSLQEEQTIIQLHALLGNRWSAIATNLPKRTDNEIKNYWNTHLKKRLTKMGIDPVTHKPKSDALGSGQWKGTANLSHMAQWESARLEAEARLVRESKMVSQSNPFQPQLGSSTTSAQLLNKAAAPPPLPPPCLDILKSWQGGWAKSIKDITISSGFFAAGGSSLASPTSTLNFSENAIPIPTIPSFADNTLPAIEYVNNTTSCLEKSNIFQERMEMNSVQFQDQIMAFSMDSVWTHEGNTNALLPNFMEGITADILLENSSDHNSLNFSGNSDNDGGSCGGSGSGAGGDFEENKNYWNSILNMVNSTTTGSSAVMI